MLELAVQVKHGTSLIRRRRHAAFHVRLSATALTPEIPVSSFVDQALKNSPELAPTLGHTSVRQENGKTVFLLSNRRGRPRESFESSSAPPIFNGGIFDGVSANREEMFHSDGSVYVLPDKLQDFPDDLSELKEMPFSYQVYSKFDRFDNRGNIIHSLHPQAQGLETSLIEDLNVQRITQLAPLRVDQVRLGFETYSPRLLGGAFGSIPEVEKRLCLEVTADRIYLFLEERNLASKSRLPFESSGSLAGINKALEELNLYTDLYTSLLQEM